MTGRDEDIEMAAMYFVMGLAVALLVLTWMGAPR